MQQERLCEALGQMASGIAHAINQRQFADWWLPPKLLETEEEP